MPATVLKSLKLHRFRGFYDFSLTFASETYLVGPNNAGKSTILGAIRLIDQQLRHARSRRPTFRARHNGISYDCYPMSLEGFNAFEESVRYDFGQEEASVSISWQNGAICTAVWPDATEGEAPFFYLRYVNGGQPRGPADVARFFAPLGVVPALAPAENSEHQLTPDYVRANLSTRLSSRHFRNQLWLLQAEGKFSEFRDFANEWTSEVRLIDVVARTTDDGVALDVFYAEGARQHERELNWAGDGLQVWLQILYQVYRTADYPTLVLDEPEVFLHPDLQRRLVRLLESTDKQVVLATHSSEVVTEVEPSAITLVDRSNRRAKRMKDDTAINGISSVLGSRFNIRLAKALKSKVALFVEGGDIRLLRRTAGALGLTAIAQELGIAVLELGGFSGHVHVDAFNWLCNDLLAGAVAPYVILDRDFRSDAELATIEGKLRAAGVAGHVWRRKELESYYLDPPLLARGLGVPVARAEAILLEVTEAMRTYVFSRLVSAESDFSRPSGVSVGTVVQKMQPEFDRRWSSLDYRLAVCPAKDALSAVNVRSQHQGGKAVSFARLAATQGPGDVPQEMREVLDHVLETLSNA